jgi:hypothetical protein
LLGTGEAGGVVLLRLSVPVPVPATTTSLLIVVATSAAAAAAAFSPPPTASCAALCTTWFALLGIAAPTVFSLILRPDVNTNGAICATTTEKQKKLQCNKK